MDEDEKIKKVFLLSESNICIFLFSQEGANDENNSIFVS